MSEASHWPAEKPYELAVEQITEEDGRSALAEIRSRTGPVTIADLRLRFCSRLPGLLDRVGESLGTGPAEVLELARGGALRYDQLREAVSTAEPTP